MKTIINLSKNLATIKMGLFTATQQQALKGSKIWKDCWTLLNWLSQYNEEDTIIICNNPDVEIEIKEKKNEDKEL